MREHRYQFFVDDGGVEVVGLILLNVLDGFVLDDFVDVGALHGIGYVQVGLEVFFVVEYEYVFVDAVPYNFVGDDWHTDLQLDFFYRRVEVQVVDRVHQNHACALVVGLHLDDGYLGVQLRNLLAFRQRIDLQPPQVVHHCQELKGHADPHYFAVVSARRKALVHAAANFFQLVQLCDAAAQHRHVGVVDLYVVYRFVLVSFGYLLCVSQHLSVIVSLTLEQGQSTRTRSNKLG